MKARRRVTPGSLLYLLRRIMPSADTAALIKPKAPGSGVRVRNPRLSPPGKVAL